MKGVKLIINEIQWLLQAHEYHHPILILKTYQSLIISALHVDKMNPPLLIVTYVVISEGDVFHKFS